MEKLDLQIRNVIIACLMGTGEKVYKQQQPYLYVEYSSNKMIYLKNYLFCLHKSNEHIQSSKLNCFYIKLNSQNEQLVDKWYKEQKKIFSINPQILTIESIFIWIHLFGQRRVENLEVATSLTNEIYIRNLIYCIGKQINLVMLPGSNSVKFPQVKEVFYRALKYSLKDSTLIASLLTKKEVKQITEKRKEAQHYEFKSSY